MVQSKSIFFCLLIASCAFINAQQIPTKNIVDAKQENPKDVAAAPPNVSETLPEIRAALKIEEHPLVSEKKDSETAKDVVVTSSPAPAVAADTTTSKSNGTTSTTSTSSTTTSTTTTTPPSTKQSTTTTTSSTTSSSTTTTTTTTAAPITTSTKSPPQPTPKPTPSPIGPPQIGQWNSSCIIVKMAAQLNFTYVTKDDKNATALLNIPQNAVVNDVECNATVHQTMDINWGPKSAVNMMLFQFSLTNKSVALTQIVITLNLASDEFPDAKENQTIQLLHVGKDFMTPLQMSYHCTRSQKFNLTETVNNYHVMGTIDLSDVQMEAFRKQSNSTSFSTVHDCDASGTSDVVPIAVGLALVSLILIVLIAYLCARRRSTLRGYMSF